MEPATLLYVLIGAFGLLSADAYTSSSTVFLQTSVADIYANRGYTSEVVESILASTFNDISDTSSLSKRLVLMTSHDLSISKSLADAAGLGASFDSLKSSLGVSPIKILVSIIEGSKDESNFPQIIIIGVDLDGKSFRIKKSLDSIDSLDDELHELAILSMAKVNPYITSLYTFEKAQEAGLDQKEAMRFVSSWLTRSSTQDYSPERAKFENLNGLILLLQTDTTNAEMWFTKALRSDPGLNVARLNAGFTYLFHGNFSEAIQLLEPLTESHIWTSEKDELIPFAANIMLGNAYTSLGKFDEANGYFSDAISLRPEGAASYYYWARSLRKQGKQKEATELYLKGELYVKQLISYAEVAPLYFWLPEEVNGPLVRRTTFLPKLSGTLTP